MRKQARHLYEFGPFVLDPGERLLLHDQGPVKLPPKAFDMLTVLVRNVGRVVDKESLFNEVWAGATVEEGNIPWTVSLLRKALGDNPGSPLYIETVPGRGYRFIAPVKELSAEVVEPGADDKGSDTPEDDRVRILGGAAPAGAPPPTETVAAAGPFGGFVLHAVTCCSLYASLYTVALFIEVAYRFDRLGPTALRLAPWVFLWVWGTSLMGLWAGWRRAWRGESWQLASPLTVFIGAAFLLYALLGLFLPATPVTDAVFQTYTAHVAYLKNVGYFLLLATLFVIIPFHLVIALRRELRAGNRKTVLRLLTGRRAGTPPEGAVYLRVWWLGVVLSCAAVIALALTSHLFESLRPGPYMNLFMQLAQWRLILSLLVGAECLIWYYRELNKIRHESSD